MADPNLKPGFESNSIRLAPPILSFSCKYFFINVFCALNHPVDSKSDHKDDTSE